MLFVIKYLERLCIDSLFLIMILRKYRNGKGGSQLVEVAFSSLIFALILRHLSSEFVPDSSYFVPRTSRAKLTVFHFSEESSGPGAVRCHRTHQICSQNLVTKGTSFRECPFENNRTSCSFVWNFSFLIGVNESVFQVLAIDFKVQPNFILTLLSLSPWIS